MFRRIATVVAGLMSLIPAAALTSTSVAIPVHAGGHVEANQSVPYIVTYRVRGIRISLRFASRSYPRDALIAVTDTVTNLSHRHLAATPPFNPAGYPCSPPMVSLRSVNARGQDVTPMPPIPFPAPGCPLPPPSKFPAGTSRVEHQLNVLWTPRLAAAVVLYTFVRENVSSFHFSSYNLNGPTIRFHLRRQSVPQITVLPGGASARVTPPPGATGRYYWEGWGTCSTAAYGGTYWPPYWTLRSSRTIAALCQAPQKWYLAVAWLNHSVTSVAYP